MDGQFLMTFEYYKIVPIAFMIPEKQVLAVGRIYFLPIFQRKFNCRQWRMSMEFITQMVFFKKFENTIDFII
jgi:hypothetical protein